MKHLLDNLTNNSEISYVKTCYLDRTLLKTEKDVEMMQGVIMCRKISFFSQTLLRRIIISIWIWMQMSNVNQN